MKKSIQVDTATNRKTRNLCIIIMCAMLLVEACLMIFADNTTLKVMSTLVTMAVIFTCMIIAGGDRHIKHTLIIPSIIIMFAVTIVPLIFLIVMSLTNVKLMNFNKTWKFVGFDNFKHFLSGDTIFWPALWRTLEYTVLSLFAQLVVGLGLALLFQTNFKGRSVVSSFLVIPVMTCPIVIAMLWKSMMNSEMGILNNIIRGLGGRGINWLTNDAVKWLQSIPVVGGILYKHFNANVGFFSLIMINTWQWTPFVFLMFLAGINSLPTEPFEAAHVDGATVFQTFRCITLPLLKPVMRVVILMRLIDLMKVYDQIYALFGDNIIARTLNIHIFSVGLTQQNYGRGSALSIIVLCFIMLLTKSLMFMNERMGNNRAK